MNCPVFIDTKQTLHYKVAIKKTTKKPNFMAPFYG